MINPTSLPANTALPQFHEGMRAVVDQYDLFIVDQWGVLHDGEKLHPGALEGLQGLKDTGKPVVLLSNSGKRVSDSYDRLARLGISRDMYDLCLTSGEQVFMGLRDRVDPFYASLGERFLIFAWDENRGIVDGLGYREVDQVDDADFIICAGTGHGTLDPYLPFLDKALERGLPMTCANPDKISVQPDGSLKICPGTIAARYEEMGGTVKWHGKPQRNAYDAIRAETGVTSGLALGIGDSLAHDIAGAVGAGMDGWFITNGIHRTDLSSPPKANEVADLGHQYNAVPTHFSVHFQW